MLTIFSYFENIDRMGKSFIRTKHNRDISLVKGWKVNNTVI